VVKSNLKYIDHINKVKVTHMQDGKDVQAKNMLRVEIEAIQGHYKILKDYVAGKQSDNLEIMSTFQVFKEGLSQVSAYILTLYVLNKQKTKITWEPLLANISNALETLRASAHPNPRGAIELAFNMSEPNAEEVMAYLAKLKASLQ
jgi:hypothetical protein